MNNKKSKENQSSIITINKRAQYEYFILNEFEAGLVLQGWEVRSLRSGSADIKNSYVTLKNGEAFLSGANFAPLMLSSIHYFCDPLRNRKLLLNQNELNILYGCNYQKGYTIIALSLYWSNVWCKIRIGIAKGKKKHDKRSSLKEREWRIHKSRFMNRKH